MAMKCIVNPFINRSDLIGREDAFVEDVVVEGEVNVLVGVYVDVVDNGFVRKASTDVRPALALVFRKEYFFMVVV